MFSRVIKHTLNFDGSHNNQNKKASAGCIIRDKQGDLVVAASYNLTIANFRCDNVAIAEAMGLKNGLLLARKKSLILDRVKGDNKEVIDLVLDLTNSRPGPTLSAIISEIRGMLDLHVVVVEHIRREDNKVADQLARMGSRLTASSKVFLRNASDLPSPLTELIKQDKGSSLCIARHDGEGSSSGENNIDKIGGAVVGLMTFASLAYSAYSFFSSGESSTDSSDQPKAKTNAIVARKALNINTESFSSSINDAPKSLEENPGFYTLQYFGSDRNQVQKARAGCIITNNGSFVVASAHNLDHEYPGCNIAIAEAIALKMGLKLAQDNDIRLSLIQGRNAEVRDRVLGREKRPPKSPELIVMIKQVKSALYCQQINPEDDEKLQLVREDEIGTARALATVGGKLDKEMKIYNWIRDLPTEVAVLVNY